MNKTCCVHGCDEKHEGKGQRTFFKLPKDPKILKYWLELVQRQDLANETETKEQMHIKHRICSAHFSEEDIQYIPVLIKNAVPKLHLPNSNVQQGVKQEKEDNDIQMADAANIPQTSTGKIEVDTEQKIENPNVEKKTSQSNSAAKAKLRKALAEAKNEIKQLKKQNKNKITKEIFMEWCDKFLEKRLATIVKCQTVVARNKKMKNRYTDELKTFAQNLFFCSNLAYRYLQPYFNLPCKRTLNRMHIHVNSGVSEKFQESLKTLVSEMSPHEKMCNVCVDYMPIYSEISEDVANKVIYGRHEIDGIATEIPARFAVVIMLTGTLVKWRLALAYALTAECKDYPELISWIDRVIVMLMNIGFDVRCLVTDTSAFFWKAAQDKKISVRNTHFAINGKKIFYIFDAPHLLKEAREFLLRHDFKFLGNKVGKLDYIKTLYDKGAVKAVPKLTLKHITQSTVAKTRTIIAAQLFSVSVARAIGGLVTQKVVEQKAEETAELVITLNDLFDMLNSQPTKEQHEFKRPYRGTAVQIEHFNEFLMFLESLKVIRKQDGKVVPTHFANGFIVTIRSVMDLFEDLRRQGYNVLFTRLLNMDSLEFFFPQIKKFGGKDKVGAATFIKAFARLSFRDTLKLPGRKL